ncbi:MAG: DNA circularization N-terminal domain-containing protein [Acidiphilium sp.]
MVDIVGLFDSLLGASIGGVAFEVIDTSDSFGRRVQRLLFPGVDAPTYQDMGAQDEAISINGLLVGDDYVQQAAMLRRALQQPGPLTLVHPWLGNLQVVLQGPGSATIRFSDGELRLARFSATLLRYTPPGPLTADTFSALIAGVRTTIADAQNWIAATLAPAVMPLAAFGYAQSWLGSMAAGWSALVGSGSSGAAIGPACAAPIAALTVPAVTPDAAWAQSVASAVAGVPGAIVSASQPAVPSAVAPGGSVTAPVAADPADATAMLVQGVQIATGGATAPSPGPALASALQAVVVANAIAASALIAYDSVQAAEAEAQTLLKLLDAAIATAATQAQASPQLAAPVWDDLVGLKSALMADLNAAVGRLPSVVTVTTRTALPAWLIANYISGDTPSLLPGCYADIVARNKVSNPATVPAGALEVLQVQPPATAVAA